MSVARRQLQLRFKQHGGRRPGAGRKPSGERPGVPHRARPTLAARHPVHVTLRLRAAVGCLRRRPAYGAIRDCLAAANARGAMRVVHYSVMSNHLHLIIEAADRMALARGVQGLSIRMARALNRVQGRAGRVLADRYHARILLTPREVRRALAYVLNNARRHRIVGPEAPRTWIDPCSSADAFDGWTRRPAAHQRRQAATAAIVAARSWLLRIGWRRHGPIDPSYVPG